MVRKGLMSVTVVLWCLFLIVPKPAAGENYIEILDQGRIDWTNGFIEAMGVGAPPPNPLNPAHARAVAENHATIAARRNLLEIVKNIRVNSETRVLDHMAAKEMSEKALETLLIDAKTVDLSYERDEKVGVKLSMKLQGSLAEFMLPEDILIISTVKQPKEQAQKEEPFTGLIVDCKGVSLEPAVVPLILDEDGAILYGPAFVSREHAVERRMASYVRETASAESDLRVGSNPLKVKGIRTFEGKACDVMISHADAARIRGLASNFNFLHQCRVLLVVD
ncbi:MAG: hypothetical protein JW836_01500 [Deltaproteobacteria bacterium]|nr:hypothetical protein [Deltaproteobacteria bacterium]